jgi:hypothetical protein
MGRKCTECDKFASFNIKGKPVLYCSEHKKDGMINVLNKNVWNVIKDLVIIINEKKPLYCAEHKKDGMIDVNAKNVKNVINMPYLMLTENDHYIVQIIKKTEC